MDVLWTVLVAWFFGPRGLVLRDARPMQFIPAKGALGYFDWEAGDMSIVPPPAAWMLPKPPKLEKTIMRTQPLPLFED